jgi:aminoglycoside phosphotransferase (APT) family kinase protein
MTDDPTDVMLNRHAAYTRSPSAIAALVQHTIAQSLTTIQPIVRGYDSEVYRATRPLGSDLIVRIRRYGSVSYASEAWAIEQCRMVGVPVPEILFVGMAQLGSEECEVMLQLAIPGRPLSELSNRLSRTELAHVWAQAGAALAQIHSIPVDGFYKMRQPGVWDFPDWESILHSANDDRNDDIAQLAQGVVSAADALLLREMLTAGEAEAPCLQPVLLHGDFLPGHLFFTDDLRLCGVIDFGDFQGGPRITDIANIHMSVPQLDMAGLRAGYGEQEPFDDGFERRLLLTGAELQIGYLAHFLREGNHQEAEPILHALNASIAAWPRLR